MCPSTYLTTLQPENNPLSPQFCPLTNWVLGCGGGGVSPKGQFSRDPLPVFSARSHHELFQHKLGCLLSDVVLPAFPVPTAVSPTLQCDLKNVAIEAVMVRDMLKPCEFSPLDSCRKKFLGTQKDVDLALHPVTGLVLQEGYEEKFPKATGLESVDLFPGLGLLC